ncbi:MAG: phosphoadenosine phosphosulfate reductase domain-containing protein [Candidatus Ranarchaeia archaeon]|jgi:phosphoadenosine phosphosulfate reductase
MSHPYLGRLVIHWCDQCNLPIVDAKKCVICDSKTRSVPITPPGDTRPAFPDWIIEIRKIFDRDLGEGSGDVLLPQNKLVLLNHASYYDRLDEVIVDGYILAKIGYHPLKGVFETKLTVVGGRRLVSAGLGKRVVIDDGAVKPISRGANVLAVGVTSTSKEVKKGDEVIVTNQDGEVVAVGKARMPGKKMIRGKGLAVRPRDHAPPSSPIFHVGGQTWNDAIKANEPILTRYETKAINFVKNTVLGFSHKVAVAFSGGKDSLLTLLLVKKALPDQDWAVFFADTGIEFPETIDYIDQVIKKYGLQERFHVEHAGDRFWTDLQTFGPPARDYRWCCKTCKLGPINQIIKNDFGGKTLTFIGQRRYESDKRANEPAVSVNPWVAGQVRATPIKQWVALLVWLYIMKEHAPINPLYEKGYERIGCWMCPANKLADLDQLNTTHPDLSKKWETALESYKNQHSLPEIWRDLALWRWKTLPGTMTNLFKDEDISYKHQSPLDVTPGATLEYTLAQGVSPCINGGITVEGHFSSPLNLARLVKILPILGKPRYSQDMGALHLQVRSSKNVTMNLFTSGAFTIRGIENHSQANKLAQQLSDLVKREIRCTGCELCQTHCPNDAISMVGGKIQVDYELCDSCGLCTRSCPALLM